MNFGVFELYYFKKGMLSPPTFPLPPLLGVDYSASNAFATFHVSSDVN